MKTKFDININNKLLIKYFIGMKNKIYKCLPMYEEESPTLGQYLNNLLYELCGGAEIMEEDIYVELINKLAYVNRLDTHEEYKRQIFDCLNTCEKIIKRLEG